MGIVDAPGYVSVFTNFLGGGLCRSHLHHHGLFSNLLNNIKRKILVFRHRASKFSINKTFALEVVFAVILLSTKIILVTFIFLEYLQDFDNAVFNRLIEGEHILLVP